ncbi:gp624 [Bacillus phage G]|uniref:Gp624 n=1 Tax=Bacillus phage G TaxID=2884420 RepID=G3MB04_9CAUD|nr:gp624 [Bacillus phage G]AEO93869.1 gp624 [Bacillus phage G]
MKKLNIEDNWEKIYKAANELGLTVISGVKEDVVKDVNKEIDKKMWEAKCE